MPGKHPFKPVMHCTFRQVNKVVKLATTVIDKLTANSSLYPAPDPTVAALTTERDKLVTYIGDGRNGGKEATAKRDAQSKLVFEMLQTEILYVIKTAGNDKDKILLSGFDINEQPAPKDVPGKVTLKRTEPGPVPHSQKILLEKFNNPNKITKDKFTFHVEITTDASKEDTWDDAEFADGTRGMTGNSKKIIIVNLLRGKEYFVRIAASNSKGRGPWSDNTSFIAQ